MMAALASDMCWPEGGQTRAHAIGAAATYAVAGRGLPTRSHDATGRSCEGRCQRAHGAGGHSGWACLAPCLILRGHPGECVFLCRRSECPGGQCPCCVTWPSRTRSTECCRQRCGQVTTYASGKVKICEAACMRIDDHASLCSFQCADDECPGSKCRFCVWHVDGTPATVAGYRVGVQGASQTRVAAAISGQGGDGGSAAAMLRATLGARTSGPSRSPWAVAEQGEARDAFAC